MLDITPEKKILQSQLEILRKEYAALYEKHNYMKQYEESVLTSLYLSLIGQLQFRLFCLQGDLQQLNLRIQLAQAYFNRNELPEWTKIDQQVLSAFEGYQQKIEAEAQRLAAAKELLKADFLNDEQVYQLKNVYKLLVKKLHPDLNPHQSDAEKELFLKVQAAYDLCDLRAMNELLLYVDGLATTAPEVLANLPSEIKKLEKMTEQLHKKIRDLNAVFPFSFRDLLSDENRVDAEQKVTEKKIVLVEEEIKTKTEYLLLLKSWKPELLN